MKRSLVILVLAIAPLSACLDWTFGTGPGGGGREGEGEGGAGNEGEGAGGEGEGAGGEGEGPAGPLWITIGAPITAQAELAGAQPSQLSSSNGRLFAVGTDHLFELVADAITPIAAPAVPCAGVNLTGPVAVDGDDLIVAASNNVVRFHDDGSCDPPYAVESGEPVLAVTAFHGGALVFDGQELTLFDTSGAVVDTHSFDSFTGGTFSADAGDASAVVLVRGDAQSPGQVVALTMPATQIVVQIVSDSAGIMAGANGVSVTIDSSLGAPFLTVSVGDGTTHANVRVAANDSITAVAADADGEVAAVGPSALAALTDTASSSLAVSSASGERFGTLTRIVQSPAGDVWAVGATVILHWSSSGATGFHDPDIIDRDVSVNDQGALVATGASLFFTDPSEFIHRADVSGNTLDVVDIVDSVSFSQVRTADFRSRFAFLPASGSDPARLVEATTTNVVSYELTADLGAVTTSLPSTTLVSSVSAVAMLDDASKVAYGQFSTLIVCAVDLPVGASPTATCDGGRETSVSTVTAITVIDPSPGVDDETYVVSSSNGVAILDPGNNGRFFAASSNTARPLLINDCVLGFGSDGWTALDQDHPLAPAARRGFVVSDAAAIGNRVLLVGGGGEAGQLSSIPLPATSTCHDAGDAPVLDGTAMLNGAVRSQTDLNAAAFLAGELYVLDADGLLWHVPTP